MENLAKRIEVWRFVAIDGWIPCWINLGNIVFKRIYKADLPATEKWTKQKDQTLFIHINQKIPIPWTKRTLF